MHDIVQAKSFFENLLDKNEIYLLRLSKESRMDALSTRENEHFVKYPKLKIYIHDVDDIFILTSDNDE